MLCVTGVAESLEETFAGLQDDGERVKLTEENKHRFVQMYVRAALWKWRSEALVNMQRGYGFFLSM